jgi:hypothetical protein
MSTPAHDHELEEHMKSEATETGPDTSYTVDEFRKTQSSNRVSRALKFVTTSLRRSQNSKGERSPSPNKRATSQGEPSPNKISKKLFERIALECRVAYINLKHM